MQELSTPAPAIPNTSEEVLVTREVTFRNSTFGALKTYMRGYKRRTGVTLTNAAALDLILRAYLPRYIHPDATKTMLKLSRPLTLDRLQALPTDPQDEPHTAPVATPTRRAPVINVDVSIRPRSFVKTSAQEAPNV